MDELDWNELPPCPWCGMPMEVKTEWGAGPAERVVPIGTPMATARCLSGHWYGGPLSSLVGNVRP